MRSIRTSIAAIALLWACAACSPPPAPTPEKPPEPQSETPAGSARAG